MPGRLNRYRRVSCWKAHAGICRLQATREDIIKCAVRCQLEELRARSSAPGGLLESGDMQFHLAIAEATHNSISW